MKRHILPLGIDIGQTRLRIAEVALENGAPILLRAAAIDTPVPGDPQTAGAGLEAKLQELGIRGRRCVLSMGEPHATLRTVSFPPMSARERARAATFEAQRFLEEPNRSTTVRTEPIDSARGLYALGIAQTVALHQRLAVARAARLRPLAVDHDAYAFRRALPFADAILDMGTAQSRLYAYGSAAPVGLALDSGSETFTAAIARSLGVDDQTAERRKRATGFAGAGESELAAFSYSIGRGLLAAKSHGISDIQKIVIVGNGARLPGLASRLERDTGCSIDVASYLAVGKSTYPEDIVRASAPDWALAVGLATWNVPMAAAA